MSQENVVFMIDALKNDELGLKIVVVKDNITGKYYAVIIEVNPFGICYKEHVKAGDLLLSINGTDIESYNILNKMATKEKDSGEDGNNNRMQLQIMKRGTFNIPGLFGICSNSPCSEFCQTWDNDMFKLKSRKPSVEKVDIKPKVSGETMTSKTSADKLIPRFKKLSCSNLEDSVHSNNHLINNPPKYKYQKALPMKKKEHEQKSKTILKPKRDFQSHIIQPPQPLFIKRKNNQLIRVGTSNLIESKSLTNLTSLSDTASITNNRSLDSLSSSSGDELSVSQPIYVPKTLSSNNLSQDLKSENLEVTKKVSKSTDMIISDLKIELDQLRMQKTVKMSWNKGHPLEKGISKSQTNKLNRQNIY